jgi:hypothetical protein
MARSRWHVPLQVGGVLLAITGHVLGHAHGGREFRLNPHAQLASVLETWLAFQTGLGIYLKLHLEHRGYVRIRRYVVTLHAILAFGIPVLAWSQALLGAFTTQGFCHDANARQCVTRAGSGSAMVAVGIWLRVTGSHVASRQCSPFSIRGELLESLAVSLSGAMILLAIWLTKESPWSSTGELLSVGLLDLCSIAVMTAICTRSKKMATGKALAGLSLLIHGSYVLMQTPAQGGPAIGIAVGLFMQAAGLCQLAEFIFARLTRPVPATQKIPDTRVVRYSASLVSTEHNSKSFLMLTRRSVPRWGWSVVHCHQPGATGVARSE